MLETLLKFPNRLFTINELANELAAQFASTGRLVQKFNEAGIIEKGKSGRSVMVKLPRHDYLNSIYPILKVGISPQFTVRAIVDVFAR